MRKIPIIIKGMKNDNIHIFNAGTHTDGKGNQVTISVAEIDAIASNYNAGNHDAPIVLGHPKDNAPAYGWVKNLHCQNGGLYAKAHQIHDGLRQAVRDGSYKKISASFYSPNTLRNPTQNHALRHVGFLGAMPPAIKGLDSVNLSEDENFAEFTIFNKEIPMDEEKFLSKLTATLTDFAERITGNKNIHWGENAQSRCAVPPNPITTNIKDKDMNEKEQADFAEKKQALEKEQADFSKQQKVLEKQQADFAEKQRLQEFATIKSGIANLRDANKINPAAHDLALAFAEQLSAGDSADFGEGENQLTAFNKFVTEFADAVSVGVPHLGEIAANENGDNALDFSEDADAISVKATKLMNESRAAGIEMQSSEAVAQVLKGGAK